jgi:regulator of RNase E activity RraA
MTHTPDITRPDPKLSAAFAGIGTATIAAELHRLGIRRSHLEGIMPWNDGPCVAGPALTLQFMPLREDVEYGDVEKQLHRHVMYHVRPGDIVVVDARGAMDSGVFGEMMMTYLHGRGGKAAIIDGCLRDWPNIREIGIGCWIKGVTPNYHTQRRIFPYAVNVPIACGGCYVAPGDIMVADADGAVVVPVTYAERVLERASKHAEWEEFSRMNTVTVRAVAGVDGATQLQGPFRSPIPAPAFATARLVPGDALTLGVRPEDVTLQSPEEGDATGRIAFVERLGSHTQVGIQLADGALFYAIAGALDPVRVGDAGSVTLARSSLHLFDASGAALPRGSGG